MSLTVIKPGGSLNDSEHLSDWLQGICQLALKRPVVVVPGGGIFADRIREQQRRQGFDDLTAHRLALLAMCQTAYMLKEHCPELNMVADSGKVLPLTAGQAPLLWLPFELLDDASEVPASWDFTSDSIALWLAGRLQAKHLVLVKKRLPDVKPNLRNYYKKDVIDKGFQYLKKDIECRLYIFSECELALFNAQEDWQPIDTKA